MPSNLTESTPQGTALARLANQKGRRKLCLLTDPSEAKFLHSLLPEESRVMVPEETPAILSEMERIWGA